MGRFTFLARAGGAGVGYAPTWRLGQASFFLCFSLCARKKLSALSDFLRGPTQSLRVHTVDRPLHSIQNPLVNGFSSDLGQRVVEQHFQRINICKEV